ncbi:MAG: hypothetical protein V3U85_00225 [Hyphomicrobium sp.]
MAGSTNHNLIGERAIPKGSTKTITIYVLDKNNAPVDISGSKLWSMVRENIEDATAVISKANAAAGGTGMVITDGPGGVLTLDWDKTDTANRNDDQHCWDVLIELISGKRGFVIKPGARVEFETPATRDV